MALATKEKEWDGPKDYLAKHDREHSMGAICVVLNGSGTPPLINGVGLFPLSLRMGPIFVTSSIYLGRNNSRK